MTLLLDTRIILWALSGDIRLPEAAGKMITDEANRIFFSIASMWEVSTEHAHRPDRMPLSGAEFLHYCEQAGYERLSIHERHVLALESLPALHADPFDRMLVAQAVSDGLLVVTHDAELGAYGDSVCVV